MLGQQPDLFEYTGGQTSTPAYFVDADDAVGVTQAALLPILQPSQLVCESRPHRARPWATSMGLTGSRAEMRKPAD